jgi:hypothetical protein
MVDKGEAQPGDVYWEMARSRAGVPGRSKNNNLPSPTIVLDRWWTERKEAGARYSAEDLHSPEKGIRRLM